ncbi:class I SAM-dependent methyltransferase [Shewanella sp. 5_MG-2023]|uniref:class I SAM-dependent methyltransferase n=1 Tax=unclassified Shewanella TaxID=196818 RepID=UPI0026E3ADDB|nr:MULTISPECIES: class I SAM-dependent methyltransferase [unclassified Shewanella]MDO6639913.1 class I SAM-dependent methyltransferase [Shewanella sp. 5_MG-2023]MDO6777619.1 class I SAM-dependent methyltransferase [Shewanella sp. 3_MG-2023]
MSYDKSVSDHYLHGSLLEAIEAALPALGKTTENVTIEDLAPVDEFHIGGRLATDNLFDQLNFSEQGYIVDVGCGLGGAARYLASRYKNRVTGIDLTPEYIETGKALCSWLNLDEYITLEQGSALSMPFQDSSFDGGYMLHVGMNIDDKVSLFAEIFRVLKPGSTFGVYDIMRQNDGELIYPVPWATEGSTSKLSTPAQYKQAISDAGFEISKENNRRDFSLEFFKQQRAKTEANGGPPPLGLHTLMQESTSNKIKNMVDNLANDLIAPVEIIIQKV